jgi:predicted anti-sigma-YlaC factor YlaD
MNCKELKKTLPIYLDGEINPDKKKELDIHLDFCAECSLLYQKVSGSLFQLQPKKEIDEQAFYYTRLKQRMLNQVEKKSFIHSILFKKSLQLTAYFASIVIAVFIGILIGSGSDKAQYSDINYDSKDYLKSYMEYQYLNDFERENKNNILLTDTIK